MFFSLLRAQAYRRTDAKGLGTWDPEGAESASGWADRVVCRNDYLSSPIGKGAVASRADVGGGLDDIDPLTWFVFCNLCPGFLKDPDQRRLRGFSDGCASDFGLLPPQDA